MSRDKMMRLKKDICINIQQRIEEAIRSVIQSLNPLEDSVD
jgi:hypothetical protein